MKVDNRYNSSDSSSDYDYYENEEEKKVTVEEISNVDVFTIYFKEVNNYSLITPDEEIYLFKKLHNSYQYRNLCLEELKKAFTPEHKLSLKGKIRESERTIQSIKDKIVVSNLRLVVSIAKRYQNRFISLIDIINEGNIGLLEAVDKYDFRKGNKFSTYALYWIKQSITKALSDKSRVIRIPNYLSNILIRMNDFIEQEKKISGKEPSAAILAKKFGFSERKINQIMELNKEISYLEEPVQLDSQTVVGDYIASENLEHEVAESMLSDAIKNLLQNALHVLFPRERLVIELRYGLNSSNKAYTLEEAGKILNLTRERIRQIQNKALQKIRESPYAKSFYANIPVV